MSYHSGNGWREDVDELKTWVDERLRDKIKEHEDYEDHPCGAPMDPEEKTDCIIILNERAGVRAEAERLEREKLAAQQKAEQRKNKVASTGYPDMIKVMHDAGNGLELMFEKYLVESGIVKLESSGWLKPKIAPLDKIQEASMSYKNQITFFKDILAPTLDIITDENAKIMDSLKERISRHERQSKKLTELHNQLKENGDKLENYKIVKHQLGLERKLAKETLKDSELVQKGYHALKQEIETKQGVFSKMYQAYSTEQQAKILLSEIEEDIKLTSKITVNAQVFSEMMKYTAETILSYGLPKVLEKQQEALCI